MGQIINIISYVFLGLLVFGFLCGFVRSFKKSIARTILIAISFIVALIVGPLLSGVLIKTFVKGYIFDGFGLTINFEEMLGDMANQGGALSDILSASATQNLVTNFMNIILNIVAFLIIFIALLILTLICYWIGSIIVKVTNKKKDNYEEKKAKSKKLSYRLLGSLFGVVSSFIICFSLFIPVYGIMGIFDQFLAETSTEQSAGATTNLISGKLYYTEDENIGEIEGYIKSYEEIKTSIDNSILGKVSNGLGISKLGESAFIHLTTANQGGVKISLSEEIVTVIKIYNIYKEEFVANTFSFETQEEINNALDVIEEIYSVANNSTIVKSYLVELIPKLREKWVVEKTEYLGMKFPLEEDNEFYDIALNIIDKGFNTVNITEINDNVYSLIDTIRILNDSQLIVAIKNNEDIMQVIKNDETDILKHIIVELSESKFGDSLPNLLSTIVKKAYSIVVDDSKTAEQINGYFAEADASIPEQIDWNKEGESLNNLIINSLGIIDMFNKEEQDIDLIIESFEKIGIVIDIARSSQFTNHFKILVTDMIDIKFSDDDVLGTITGTLNSSFKDNWAWIDENGDGVVDFKYEDVFKTLKQTALLAQKLNIDTSLPDSDNLDDLVNDLEGVVGEIIKNPEMKETFKNILEEDIIDTFIPEDQAGVIKDIVGSFIDNTTEESLKQDITAAKEVIDIVNKSMNDGSLTFETEDDAKTIVENLANSNAVMTVIDTAISTEATNNLQGYAEVLKENMQVEDVQKLTDAINSLSTESEDTEEQSRLEKNKENLLKLFGLI